MQIKEQSSFGTVGKVFEFPLIQLQTSILWTVIDVCEPLYQHQHLDNLPTLIHFKICHQQYQSCGHTNLRWVQR